MATIDEAENTMQHPKATAEGAAHNVTDEDKVSAEGKAKMSDHLKQAGYG